MPRIGYIPINKRCLKRGSKMEATVLKNALIYACEHRPCEVEKKYGFKHGTAQRLVKKCRHLNLTKDKLSEMIPAEVQELYYERKTKEYRNVNNKKEVIVIRPDLALLENKLVESSKNGQYGSQKKLTLTKHVIIEKYYLEDANNKKKVEAGEGVLLSESRVTHLWREYQSKFKTPTYRREHELAGEAQYDFTGVKLPYVVDGETLYATFMVGVLSASGHIFLKAIKDQTIESSCNAIADSFRYWEGVPKAIRIDNYKAAVRQFGKYNGELTEEMQNLATFFDVDVIACRPYSPKDKGLSEAVVRFATKYAIAIANHEVLSGRQFNSLEEINRFIKPLVERMNQKKLKRINTSRQQMFEECEKQLLSQPKSYDYSVSTSFMQRVPETARIMYKEHEYALPAKWIGEDVCVFIESHKINFYQNTCLIASYERKDNLKGVSAHKGFIPSNQLVFEIFGIQGQEGMLLEWARSIGPDVEKWCSEALRSRIAYQDKVRHIEKMLSLCKGFVNQYKKFNDCVKELICSHSSRVVCSTIKKAWECMDKEKGTIYDEKYNHEQYIKLGMEVIQGTSTVMTWDNSNFLYSTNKSQAHEYLIGADRYAEKYAKEINALQN